MIKVVVGRFDYNQDFEKELNTDLGKLAEAGAVVSRVEPFGGNMFLGAFIHYAEAPVKKVEAAKPAVKRRPKAVVEASAVSK